MTPDPTSDADSAIDPRQFYSSASRSHAPVTPPKPKPDVAKSGTSPIVNIRSQSVPLNAVAESLEARWLALNFEISGRVVGPISGDNFNTFLPEVNDPDAQKCDGGKAAGKLLRKLGKAGDESQMYEPLVKYFESICPGAAFYDDSNYAFEVFEGQEIKPDINVYPSSGERKKEPRSRQIRDAMFEVKFKDESDPFNDNSPEFLKSSKESKLVLGQITNYAVCHQASEFRTHSFSALIFRTYMRLLRWDRAGVVVTEKLSFKDPSLHEYFARFSAATPCERGRDATVVPITTLPDDETGYTTYRVKQLLRCDQKLSLLRIVVGQKIYYISGDLAPGSSSPIGRSTRCVSAYCPEKKILVLLKDTWRVVSPTLKPEHEIYKKLHDHNVKNIPKVYGGADIGNVGRPDNHLTKTKAYLSYVPSSPDISLRTLCHYRIVLQYIEFELPKFRNVKELIIVVRDASIAQADAAILAKILHRDISVGNIMFKRDVEGNLQGYLIDWDLSLDLTLSETAVAQPERTGTWQFIAIRLLVKGTGNPPMHERLDDVESFFHLLTWMALRYTSHILSPATLTNKIHQNFDSNYQEDGLVYLSGERSKSLSSDELFTQAGFANKGIRRVLHRMRLVLRERYTDVEGTYEDDSDEELILGKQQDQSRKVKSLILLEDPQWLPKLLDDSLENPKSNWEINGERVDHELVALVRASWVGALKRKTGSNIHLEGSNKAARTSRA
ncbi:hypothetical protein H0H93_016636, partial [Arthromyces matolae]